eukprot:9007337-Prorocentrum_lima.AAC.1
MTSSLVGSEMCIRDRNSPTPKWLTRTGCRRGSGRWTPPAVPLRPPALEACLLYTSDAADDM